MGRGEEDSCPSHTRRVNLSGSWNERSYNKTYLEILRSTLDSAGYGSTRIVAPDSGFTSVANDINSDPVFASAVWGLGAHYPNMQSGPAAEETGKQVRKFG